MWRRLFVGPPDWSLVWLVVLVVAGVAWAAAHLARRFSARAMRSILQDTLTTASPLVRAPLRLISVGTFLLVFFVLIFPAFEAVELRPRTGLPLRTLSDWAFESGLKIVLVLIFAFAAVRVVAVGVKRFEHDVNFGTGLDAIERSKRARTLGSVLSNMTTFVVIVVAALMILREFGVDISPALTGAGIIGVALGFGAQTLVRDLIGGFFLILDNRVRVGDVVAINNIGGLVEDINLRTIILRDEEGTVHVVPNGAITTLANRSMNFSYYVVNLPLAYGEDTDRAAATVKTVADGLQRDDAYTPFILEPLEVIGVDEFEPTAVRLKVRIKTAPLKQWFVGRELRRRVNRAFAEQGIEMFSPTRTVTLSSPNSQAPTAK
ncbi:MAG TPA: mechanosensitive ion channel family protein [Vicinamibacterales bacterium]|nr:mechanosensitive ion channel family protein [Vicinamibacterales bacterium]